MDFMVPVRRAEVRRLSSLAGSPRPVSTLASGGAVCAFDCGPTVSPRTSGGALCAFDCAPTASTRTTSGAACALDCASGARVPTNGLVGHHYELMCQGHGQVSQTRCHKMTWTCMFQPGLIKLFSKRGDAIVFKLSHHNLASEWMGTTVMALLMNSESHCELQSR